MDRKLFSSTICYSVFVLFSSDYGVVNIKISVSQIHHILFLFYFFVDNEKKDKLCLRRRSSRGSKTLSAGNCVCMWEVSCRPAASLFSKSRSIQNQRLRLFPSYTEYIWNVPSAVTGGRRKNLLTWFQSQNHKKKKKRENPVTADCKRPHNWYAGPQRARLLSDQPRRRTARAMHCRE